MIRMEIKFPVRGIDKTFPFAKQREVLIDLMYFKPSGASSGILRSGIGRPEDFLLSILLPYFLGEMTRPTEYSGVSVCLDVKTALSLPSPAESLTL